MANKAQAEVLKQIKGRTAYSYGVANSLYFEMQGRRYHMDEAGKITNDRGLVVEWHPDWETFIHEMTVQE